MLLHANTVVAKNVRMSISIHVRRTCEASDGDESSFDDDDDGDDDGMELVDEDDGIVNDTWDDEGITDFITD